MARSRSGTVLAVTTWLVAGPAARRTAWSVFKRVVAFGVACVLLWNPLGSRWFGGEDVASASPVPIEQLQTPPADAYQLIVVSADGLGETFATLQTFERDSVGSPWRSVLGPIDARIGRSGFRADRSEGDGSTPSGTYTLTEAFGIKAAPVGTKLPHRVVGPNDWWISDRNRPDIYNTWQTHPNPVPWNPNRAEHLIDFKPSYNHSVVIDFNRGAEMVVGRGSAIFLHVDNGNPTSGCVAIAEAQLVRIMQWLDPTKRPHIMMGTLDQLLKVKEAPAVTAGPSGGLQQVTPTRVLDTRENLGAPGPLAGRTTLDVKVTGGGAQVPADASAVALNVTLTEQTESTFLTVYPTPSNPAQGPPLVSNVNAVAGDHRANLVLARVGDGGRVRIYNAFGRAQVVADIVGYVSAGTTGRFVPTAPIRMLDTRAGTGVANTGKVGARETIDVKVPFVPPRATGVVVNVTVDAPTQPTWIAAYQGYSAWNGTSTVNTDRSETSANLAMVPLAADGTIRMQNAFGASHLVADVQGYIVDDGSQFTVAQTPVRVLDTRDGVGSRGRLTAGALAVVDIPGLPPNATAVAVTVTAVDPSVDTFIRVTGTSDTGSQSSNVNLRANETRANLAIVPVGTDGRIVLRTHTGDVHLVVDVSGWFAPV